MQTQQILVPYLIVFLHLSLLVEVPKLSLVEVYHDIYMGCHKSMKMEQG